VRSGPSSTKGVLLNSIATEPPTGGRSVPGDDGTEDGRIVRGVIPVREPPSSERDSTSESTSVIAKSA